MSSFGNFVLWLYGSLGNKLSIFSHFASTETSMTKCFAFASFPLFMLLTFRSYARILHPSVFFMSSTEQGVLNISTDLPSIPIKTKLASFIFYLPTWTIYFLQMVTIKSLNSIYGDITGLREDNCLPVKLHRLSFENIKLCHFSCCFVLHPPGILHILFCELLPPG